MNFLSSALSCYIIVKMNSCNGLPNIFPTLGANVNPFCFRYREAFELQPDQYSGMNLAILLVSSGKDLSKSEELQRVCMCFTTVTKKSCKYF